MRRLNVMTQDYPNYWSTLTANVRYDKTLKANEKLLFSEITALSNKQGYCHATNKYFAQLYDKSSSTISDWINHLKQRGYLEVLMVKDGKQIKERRLFPIFDPIREKPNTPSEKAEGEYTEKAEYPFRKTRRGYTEKAEYPIPKNPKENNTSINNTSKNIDDDDSAYAREGKLEFEEDPFILARQANIDVNSELHLPVFVEFIEKLGNSIVCWAIRKTANNATYPNWQYLQTVMKNLEDNSVNTVEQAEQLSKDHKKKSSYNNKRKPIKEPMPEWTRKSQDELCKKADPEVIRKVRERIANRGK
ncbi:hypothetical protein C5O77_03550 [Limosilactobacillus reuteri]|uniref:DnaB/C C-terminal domain-containing protein n=2 Tax=Limosilactobacillus reuteri TaxID=1598 RepID=A0A3M6SE45_LIMRT|nr:hypothetical protein C5O77_03550 [Limosilactobacillus reuteri]